MVFDTCTPTTTRSILQIIYTISRRNLLSRFIKLNQLKIMALFKRKKRQRPSYNSTVKTNEEYKEYKASKHEGKSDAGAIRDVKKYKENKKKDD